ncbi:MULTISPECIES: hypothetical protein [unclassified Ensifer]|uniref:hypothetical protein n=1 Tax=unclassified Ensifer TaxID=2633371 RepID=UPI0030106092
MLSICRFFTPRSCRSKILITTVLLALIVLAVFAGRIVLNKVSQPIELTIWSHEEKERFKLPLSSDELAARTAELVKKKTDKELNPHLAWNQSRADRSVPLRIGTGSEALRNAEHFLFARAFVSHWDSKPARAIAGVAAFGCVLAWSIGKTFDSYSVPTSAELQSGINGIFSGYRFPGIARETPGGDWAGYYSWMPAINSILVVAAVLVVLTVVAGVTCRLRACLFTKEG